jgi:hypothetical protein
MYLVHVVAICYFFVAVWCIFPFLVFCAKENLAALLLCPEIRLENLDTQHERVNNVLTLCGASFESHSKTLLSQGKRKYRVTRLGEFSPLGRLFTLGSFLITDAAQIFQATFFLKTNCV